MALLHPTTKAKKNTFLKQTPSNNSINMSDICSSFFIGSVIWHSLLTAMALPIGLIVLPVRAPIPLSLVFFPHRVYWNGASHFSRHGLFSVLTASCLLKWHASLQRTRLVFWFLRVVPTDVVRITSVDTVCFVFCSRRVCYHASSSPDKTGEWHC